VKWSFKQAFNVTTIPIGCSDERYKQVVDSAREPLALACMALTYRPSDNLMEDIILLCCCSEDGRQQKPSWCIWRMLRNLKCTDFIYRKQRLRPLLVFPLQNVCNATTVLLDWHILWHVSFIPSNMVLVLHCLHSLKFEVENIKTKIIINFKQMELLQAVIGV